jgi:hypothetical protein
VRIVKRLSTAKKQHQLSINKIAKFLAGAKSAPFLTIGKQHIFYLQLANRCNHTNMEPQVTSHPSIKQSLGKLWPHHRLWLTFVSNRSVVMITCSCTVEWPRENSKQILFQVSWFLIHCINIKIENTSIGQWCIVERPRPILRVNLLNPILRVNLFFSRQVKSSRKSNKLALIGKSLLNFTRITDFHPEGLFFRLLYNQKL